MNYSKWDHIEVSDDEDDTHPNIDTPSLFRWRHQARIERDQQWNNEKQAFEKEYKVYLASVLKAKAELETAVQNKSSNTEELQNILNKLQLEEKKYEEKRKDLMLKEKARPLNIDTICHEGKSKTIINQASLQPKNPPTEDDAVDRMKAFVEKNDSDIKKFGMFRKPLDSQAFLISNPQLVCEETANQLVLWCLDLAMEEKFGLLDHVSHQCIVMQFLLELAKSLKCDPRSCVRPFFSKFINPEPEYDKMFLEELTAFRQRIRDRAKVKVEEAMERYEIDKRQKRLGPGGLDPVEVFESLPEDLQMCFNSKDVDMLKTTLQKMDPHEAEITLKRCIDSGLWVENAGGDDSDELADATAAVEEEEAEEEKKTEIQS